MEQDLKALQSDSRSKEPDDQYDVTGTGWHGAVLLADEINHYANESPPMIHPYNIARLRPASYQLTLGDEMHIGGKTVKLTPDTPGVDLEPHQVAVVSTLETLRIPRFLIARWSLRVAKIYEGLLWTGGPQVDPGWVGQLFCPIYNLAARKVRLTRGDGMFTIDFVRTTALTREYRRLNDNSESKKTWFGPVRRTLGEHDQLPLQSAPFEALQAVEILRKEHAKLVVDLSERARVQEDRLSNYVGTMFTVLGVIIAVVGIFVGASVLGNADSLRKLLPDLATVSFYVAGVAFVFSLLALIWVRWLPRDNRTGSG